MKKTGITLLGIGLAALLCIPFPSRAETADSRFGFDSILLGACISGKWVAADELQDNTKYHAHRIWGGHECAIYGFSGHEGNGIMTAIHKDHPEEFNDRGPEADSLVYDVQTENGRTLSLGSARLAFIGNVEAMPRRSTMLSADDKTCRDAVKRVLTRQGLRNATPHIMQIVRVDLDGDGNEEVLITSQNILKESKAFASWGKDTSFQMELPVPPDSHKGDYSLVLLRKEVNGTVRDIVLSSFIALRNGTPVDPEWKPAILHKICLCADLNGDGNMEVIIGQRYYEGYSYQVHEIKGATAKLVLENGAGA